MNEYKIDGRQPTIFRVIKNKDNPYVMIDRRPIDNPQLSYKAKGILTYLMSRPDGWEVNIVDLVNHSTDGKAAVRAGLDELRTAGHLKYNRLRSRGKITKWLIEVYEIPDPTLLPLDSLIMSPHSDFQEVENQEVENRTPVISNLSNQESSNNDHADFPQPSSQPLIPGVEPFSQAQGTNAPPIKPFVGPPDEHSVTLLPETEGERLLIARITEELRAKHGGKVGKFPSLACKRKFAAAELRLGADLGAAIGRALEAGAVSVTRVVDYVAKWHPAPQAAPGLAKIANGTPPAPHPKATPVQAPADWQP